MTLAAPQPKAARKRAIAAYVRKLRTELLLQAWAIRIEWAHPANADSAGDGNEIIAEITPVAGRFFATLRFGEGFYDLDPDESRKAVTHELLHLYHARLWQHFDTDAAGATLREALGAIPFGLLSKNVNVELEAMVDLLTAVIADRMPLPPKW